MYHDCLLDAQRRGVSWVLLNDVDEYMTILEHNTTVFDILEPYEQMDDVGAVSARNWFFGSLSLDDDEFDKSKPRLLLRDFVYRDAEPGPENQRSKMFVKPNHNTYVMVHKVAIGNETIQLDPYKTMRSSHFKHTGECQRSVRDTFLRDAFAEKLEARLAKVYHPAEPSQFYPEHYGSCPSS